MTEIACFLLEPTDEQRVSLRRYRSSGTSDKCPLPYGYHTAQAQIGIAPITYGDVAWGPGRSRIIEHLDEALWRPSHEDSRWPALCDCGYAFQPDDYWQLFTEQLWRRTDTGELTTLQETVPGAMWFAWWFEGQPHYCGPDGRSLVVKTPGGDWMVDGPASNCTLPEDREHRCWVRHGEAPRITVGKNGNTCAAGAGSILAGSYHGFLRDGKLVDA